MAYEVNVRRIGVFTSRDDLSGKFGARDGLKRLMTMSGPWQVAVVGGPTVPVVGVCMNSPVSGEGASLALGDIIMVRTGAAVAQNSRVMSDSQGRIVPFVAGNGNIDLGLALDASTGADQDVSVLMSVVLSNMEVSGTAPTGGSNTSTVAATGVTLDSNAFTVSVGGNHTIVATVQPVSATNRDVAWSTSDATIATVSATGVVTGVKAGTATITATTADGGFTATATATVSGS